MTKNLYSAALLLAVACVNVSAQANIDTFPQWNGSDVPDGTGGATVQLGPGPEYVINTRTPCLLVLSEVHYPWWRASVDDAPADLARVNYAMMGIPVPPGSHIVRVWLRPLSVWVGGAVSGACLLTWIIVTVSVRKDWQTPQPIGEPL